MTNRILWASAAVLAGALAGSTTGAYAQTSLHGHATGQCKLRDTVKNERVRKADCTIKEAADGNKLSYEIQMESADPFNFVSSDGGRTWVMGAENVTFKDKGEFAIFRWADRKLKVELIHGPPS